MRRGKAVKRKFSAVEDSLWLTTRPKLILEWYRMWKTAPVVSWLRAADAFMNKDFSLAAQHYERGLQRRPNHPARHCAGMDLAYCRYRLGDLEIAAEELSKLTSNSVALRDAYLLLGKIYDILGKPQMALHTIADGMLLFPNDLKLILSYLHTALFNGFYQPYLAEVRETALRLKRTLMLDDERQVLIDAALAHYELRWGEIEGGERMLARVLATGKAPFEAVLLRGERLLGQKRVLQGREQLSRAMRAAPRNPRPVRLLAESYLLPDEFHEPDYAEQLAMSACKLSNWKNAEHVALLSRAFDEKGDTSTAELLAERTRKLRVVVEIEKTSLESPADQIRALREPKQRSAKAGM